MDELDADEDGSEPPEAEFGEDLLSFEVTSNADGTALLKLDGELDMTNAGRVEAAVASAIGVHPRQLIVDAKHLQFADSSAIALLVKWANAVPEVHIRDPSEMLRRLLTRMGLSERLHLSP